MMKLTFTLLERPPKDGLAMPAFHQLIIAAAIFALTLPAQAADVGEKVKIHGFGGWSYGNTDGNDYLLGTEDGSYENVNFALSVSAQPYERLTIHGQAFWELAGEEEEAELDFIFAEWEFSDAARFLVGKVKHPFGIYAEIFDVGTARPFFFLPQGIYGPTGNVAESYLGVGLTGRRYRESGWGIQYDLYAGELQVPFEAPFDLLFEEGEEDEGEGAEEEGEEAIRDLLGGRLIVSTPISGLTFGFSAFTGSEEVEDAGPGEAPADDGFTVLGLHLEYLSDTWSIRGEYTNLEDEFFGLDADSAYLELAYRLNPNWQIAARYDWSDGDLAEVDVSAAPSLLEHEDQALALNYWFNPNFVMRLEYHMVDGNRFAHPHGEGGLAAAVEEGELDTETDAIVFGGQFSF